MYTKKVNCGYYPVTVHYDFNLKFCPYGSAGVVVTDTEIRLVSYTTIVCVIDRESGYMVCTGTYSNTTRKHIGAFLKEYAPNIGYAECKFCYENGYKINIYTGEIVELV